MPSRRQQIEMTAEEVDAFLDARKTLIIVGNGPRGFPHPMPMWFARDDAGRLVCTTFRKSQKVLNWRRDPRATLLAESGEDYAVLKGVAIYAQCEIVDDADAVADALAAINSRPPGQRQGPRLDDAARAAQRAGAARAAAKRVALWFTPEHTLSWDHAKLGGRY